MRLPFVSVALACALVGSGSGSALAQATAATPSPDPGSALREAARVGDLAAVRRSLDAGTPVDAPARHGQTALQFAAEGGHAEVVQLLLARGADVNSRERFFGVTPLAAALGGKHRALALLLLARGARDVTDAIEVALETKDEELLAAALAGGHLAHLDGLALKAEAERRGMAAFGAAIAAATPLRKPRPAVVTGAEALAKLAGTYDVRGGGQATVAVAESGLRLARPGAAELLLRPVGDRVFETADGSAELAFGGRAGTVEYVLLNEAGVLTRMGPPAGPMQALATAAAAETAPRQRGPARPWPQFRGPGASGVADGQGVPRTWNIASGAGVRWKAPLPGLALSSPVIHGGRVFVTSVTSAKGDATFRTGLYGDGTSVDDLSEHVFKLHAFDAASGQPLWEREVFRGAPTVRRHLKSSLANATPATDGERVVVLFGAVGALAAFAVDGTPLWKQDVGVLDANDPQSGSAEWGHASSPVIHDGLVFVQGDRRADSFLAAYALKDGAPAWRVARDETSTWATPNVLSGPQGAELVTNGRTIRGYDPKTGAVLWTLGPNSEVIVATPVIGDGVAYVTAGYPPIRPVYAIRAGSRGDLTLPDGVRSSAAIAWSHARGGTYIPSPLLYAGHLYTLNNNGVLSCYRADDGTQLYQTRIGEAGTSFSASPIAADGALYLASETGDVFVLKAGPTPELLHKNTMDEVVMATPAASDGLLIVRTLGHVVALTEAAALAQGGK